MTMLIVEMNFDARSFAIGIIQKLRDVTEALLRRPGLTRNAGLPFTTHTPHLSWTGTDDEAYHLD